MLVLNRPSDLLCSCQLRWAAINPGPSKPLSPGQDPSVTDQRGHRTRVLPAPYRVRSNNRMWVSPRGLTLSPPSAMFTHHTAAIGVLLDDQPRLAAPTARQRNKGRGEGSPDGRAAGGSLPTERICFLDGGRAIL
jgi:hypothetical protein